MKATSIYTLLALLLVLLFMSSCHQREDAFSPTVECPEDAAYTRLVDSVDFVLDHSLYNDITEATVQPALDYYSLGYSPRHWWMQAQCHFLMGRIRFFTDPHGEATVTHYLDALKILDTHFDKSQQPVSVLYGKIYRLLSRFICNHSDEKNSKRTAKTALNYALLANDTSGVVNSCANLAFLYDRIGHWDQGETAFHYVREGRRYADAKRFPYESACLYHAAGHCYRHNVALDSALYCFVEAEALLDSTCMLYHDVILSKGMVHYFQEDYQSAIQDLEQSFASKNYFILVNSAFILSMCYEKLGDTVTASRYFFHVKDYRVKENVETMENANALPMVVDYLKSREASRRGYLPWVVALVAVLLVVAVYFSYRGFRKKTDLQSEVAHQRLEEAHDALKKQSLDALIQKARILYQSGRNNAGEHILEDFNDTFPNVMPKLMKTYPDLSETECHIAVLTFLGFRIKEEASLLDLSENTVMKYRSNLKKKAGADPISSIISE